MRIAVIPDGDLGHVPFHSEIWQDILRDAPESSLNGAVAVPEDLAFFHRHRSRICWFMYLSVATVVKAPISSVFSRISSLP